MSEEQILSKPPKLCEEPLKDALLKTKLRLESALLAEARLASIEQEERLGLLKDTCESNKDATERTLQRYIATNKGLDRTIHSLDTLIDQYEGIRKELERCTHSTSEEADLNKIRRRKKDSTRVFNEMKRAFSEVLDKISVEHPHLSVQDVLQTLCNQMLDEPSAPYKSLDELGCDGDTLTFLLIHNLAQRHPDDPSLVKLKDPRS